MDLTHTYKTLQPKASEYTFFSSTNETISRTDHMLQDTKINIQLHSYTNNNKLSERRIKKTVLFTTASKRILKNKLHQGDEKSVH